MLGQLDDEAALTADIVALALQYGRYGYRRITAMPHQAGWVVSRKRVERKSSAIEKDEPRAPEEADASRRGSSMPWPGPGGVYKGLRVQYRRRAQQSLRSVHRKPQTDVQICTSFCKKAAMLSGASVFAAETDQFHIAPSFLPLGMAFDLYGMMCQFKGGSGEVVYSGPSNLGKILPTASALGF